MDLWERQYIGKAKTEYCNVHTCTFFIQAITVPEAVAGPMPFIVLNVLIAVSMWSSCSCLNALVVISMTSLSLLLAANSTSLGLNLPLCNYQHKHKWDIIVVNRFAQELALGKDWTVHNEIIVLTDSFHFINLTNSPELMCFLCLFPIISGRSYWYLHEQQMNRWQCYTVCLAIYNGDAPYVIITCTPCTFDV